MNADFNIPLTAIDRCKKWEISKDIVELNSDDTVELNRDINLQGLTDIYTILHTFIEEYMFFSRRYDTFIKIGHFLSHKRHLN
jgi:hypothetical protein